MSLRTVGERPKHNPYQLHCLVPSCRRSFRNQSGLTKHLRSCHSGQATLPQRQHSLPTNTLPIYRDNDSSSQGNQDSTPPSTPLAGSRSSPSPSLEINQPIQLPHQDESSSPVHTSHGSPRESSPGVLTPEGDGVISKVFHPLINGSYMS